MKTNRRNISLILTCTALLIAVGLQSWYHYRSEDPRYGISTAEVRLRSMDAELKTSLKRLCTAYSEKSFHNDFLHGNPSDKGISYFLYENNRLIAWTENATALPFEWSDSLRDGIVIRLKNGDHWIRTLRCGNKTVAGLALIESHYPYENKYLTNSFNPYLGLPSGSEFSENGTEFHTPDGIVIGRISSLQHEPPAWMGFGWCMVLTMLVVAYFFIPATVFSNRQYSWLIIVLIVASRGAMSFFHFPGALYDTGMFSPTAYAANIFFNSPADLFLNGLTILLVVVSILRRTSLVVSENLRKIFFIITVILLMTASYVLVHGLVMDATVSLDITDLSGIDSYTVIIITSLFLYLLSGALFLNWISGKKSDSLSFGRAMMALLLISAFTSILLFRFLHQRDLENRSRLAKKVTSERDPVAEFLFKEESSNIRSDTAIIATITRKGSLAELQSRLRTHHLKDYFGRFEWNLSLYDSTGKSIISDGPSTIDSLKLDFNSYGSVNVSPGFFSLPAQAGRMRYCGMIAVTDVESDTIGILVLQMRSSFLYTATGFPE
ncbi:MAG: hypothetical protein ACKOKF_00575, partial [Bacteroidota bacterium]